MNYTISQNTLLGSRPQNQDRASYIERDNALLMVVADGLGGYAGGEMAAEVLVDTLVDSFQRVRTPVISDPAAFLVLSISYAHSRINRTAKQRGINPGYPRTTCIACLIQNGYAYWAHVGDSRLYHFRESKLLTRTIDHSTTDPMYHQGMLDEEESLTEPSHLIRCVGGPKRPLVTLGAETKLQKEDVLMLCTDGVWRAYTDKNIEASLQADKLDDWLESMMAKSARTFRKDCDNMTAIALRWDDLPTTAPPLLALSIPELDQDKLWQTLKKHSIATANSGKRETRINSAADKNIKEIESTIAEIESFVNNLEDTL